MRAIRKINNNVAVCVDGSGRELIAFGKGIGFREMPYELDLSAIDRTFYDISEQYQPMFSEISAPLIELAAQIVDRAKAELPYELNPNINITLADHISFCLERLEKGIRIRMPLAYDMAIAYPLEMQLARQTLERVRLATGVALPEEELSGVAMAFINARLDDKPDTSAEAAVDAAAALRDVTGLIEKTMKLSIDRSSFNYARFATHFQYLVERINSGGQMASENVSLAPSLREEFPAVADCVEAIAGYFQTRWSSPVNEEEKMYLILHVNRICQKQGL